MRRIKNQKLNVAVSHYQKGLSAKIIYAFKVSAVGFCIYKFAIGRVS